MYRVRRFYNDSDPMTRIIAFVALVLLAVIIIPFLPVPWAASGGGCTDLPTARLSGSNQSILGGQSTAEDLRLEIAPGEINLTTGQALTFDVRFINGGMAPINLFLTQDRFIFRYTGQEDGLSIAIRQVGGAVLGEGTGARPLSVAPQQFDPSQVFVLPPRQRCTVQVSISPQRLAAARIGQGQFLVQADYLNRGRGNLPRPGQLTPTPVFANQGVWVGQVRSNEAKISIAPAAAPAR